MKTIQVEELEQLSADEIQVIDLRPEEEYKRGSFPGAVNLHLTVLILLPELFS